MLPISVGIIAYNEGQNIGHLLDSLLAQSLDKVSIAEIIVVSSGSTDQTNQIVKNYRQKDPRLRLVLENERRGKASAVNKFIALASEDLVVMISADLLLEKEAIEKLVSPLRDPQIGIVGSHPVPVNDPQGLTGFAAHLLWNLHHQISLETPKMGEAIAFRKIFSQIPVLSSVDEAQIEPLIRGQGYQAVYAPQAVVRNKGPETVKEFISRRRHIFSGHLATKYEYSYEVATLNGLRIFWLLLKNFRLSWRFLLWTPLVVALEMISRFLGLLDYKFKLQNQAIWEIASSTKNPASE